MASAKAKVAGADAILLPVSSGTQSQPFLMTTEETRTAIENMELPIYSFDGMVKSSDNFINEVFVSDSMATKDDDDDEVMFDSKNMILSFRFCAAILGGLGKTISTIALILKERSQTTKSSKANEEQCKAQTLNLDEEDGVSDIYQLDRGSKSYQVNGSSISGTHMHAKGRPPAGTIILKWFIDNEGVIDEQGQELKGALNDAIKLDGDDAFERAEDEEDMDGIDEFDCEENVNQEEVMKEAEEDDLLVVNKSIMSGGETKCSDTIARKQNLRGF
ncbi:Hypothetical predicted protein [Olea europaea subsp. europaea]|uniref:Uncharacterized protein n=1 Tax=Olea europaea subsp. europaea TaxID=158383 RepID=A0A8S0R9J2_OLEEU|nr:Hypothetical predicted protein [Olea europaea subsp. europaea]